MRVSFCVPPTDSCGIRCCAFVLWCSCCVVEQCLVSKAPGKNYGLIKNQWDRWNLSKYAEQFKDKPLPDNYLRPCLDPKKVAAHPALVQHSSPASTAPDARTPALVEAGNQMTQGSLHALPASARKVCKRVLRP